jgi:hypothetical protein
LAHWGVLGYAKKKNEHIRLPITSAKALGLLEKEVRFFINGVILNPLVLGPQMCLPALDDRHVRTGGNSTGRQIPSSAN